MKYGTLPSLKLSEKEEHTILSPYNILTSLPSSLEKLQKWKVENQRLIDEMMVRKHYNEKEIEKHKQSLIERTKIAKYLNPNTTLFGHLSPQDHQVMEAYKAFAPHSGMTIELYCRYLFMDKKDTLWRKLKDMGYDISQLVAGDGHKVENANDRYFQYRMLIPGTEFKDTIELRTEQWTKLTIQISAYKSFLKFLLDRVGGVHFVNEYHDQQHLNRYTHAITHNITKELDELLTKIKKGEKETNSKKITKMVSEEGSIEELIDNMNYVGQTVIPMITEKLKLVKDAIGQALANGEDMDEDTQAFIATKWKHANQLMAIVMSTYDGNRRQNYLYQTLKGLGTTHHGDNIMTMHVQTGQNPCMTKEQRSKLTTKTSGPTLTVHNHIYDFLIRQFMPIRELYYRYHGITEDTHKEEWIHFPILSQGTKIEIGISGLPRKVIAHLEGKNLLNLIKSFPAIDETKINSFTSNRHAQVTCAWNVGVSGELFFSHSKKNSKNQLCRKHLKLKEEKEMRSGQWQ